MLGIKRLIILDKNNVFTADDSYKESRGVSPFISYEYWIHNSSKDIFVKVGRGVTIGSYIVISEQEALKRAILDWGETNKQNV